MTVFPGRVERYRMGWAGGSGQKHFSRSRTGQTVVILDLPYGDISTTTVSHPPLPN
jgi:hypothetical protein